MKSRWNYNTAFYPGESRFSKALEKRIEQAMGLRPENGGKFQITSYPNGIEANRRCVRSRRLSVKEKLEMKSYAEATAEDPEKEKLRSLTPKSLNWDPEKMKRYMSKVEREATNVKLVMSEEKKEMLRNSTRVCRTFSNESRRIEIAPEFQIEAMVSC
ncbi:Hypothetical predicted protein [Octopus vulgaris]|uniref:Uncharacterized protein n=1 Tax=Octopus vulgaris TaxID=6645 RepID=A0AA36B7M9_OCTVU|nr:Hypothetical predicted protein [Octopus vulgaris]